MSGRSWRRPYKALPLRNISGQARASCAAWMRHRLDRVREAVSLGPRMALAELDALLVEMEGPHEPRRCATCSQQVGPEALGHDRWRLAFCDSFCMVGSLGLPTRCGFSGCMEPGCSGNVPLPNCRCQGGPSRLEGCCK